MLDRLGKPASGPADKPAQPKAMVFPTRQKKQTPAEPAPPPEVADNKAQADIVQREDLRAKPSIFAETLFGRADNHYEGGVPLAADQESENATPAADHAFKLPYMTDSEYIKRDPFLKPSPDDVVLRAQGKES